MTNVARIVGSILSLASFVNLAYGQCRIEQMTLVSAALPVYPDLAHQASVQGEVVLTFDAVGSPAPSPTNIRVVSGNPVLTEGAKKELTTWRVWSAGPDASHERNCRTTFRYSLSDKRVSGTQDLEIHFHGLSMLDIKTDEHETEEHGAPTAR